MSSTTMQNFVTHCPDYTAEGTFEKRMSVRSAHQARMQELIKAGTIIWGGFMMSPESVLPGTAEGDKKLVGSTFVVRASTIGEVREIIETDQYWVNNVWDRERVSILPFVQVVPAVAPTS